MTTTCHLNTTTNQSTNQYDYDQPSEPIVSDPKSTRCLIKKKISELLKDPSKYVRVHSKLELTLYASCVFRDLKNNQGDPVLWWLNNYPRYDRCREAGAHFWERVSLKGMKIIEFIDHDKDVIQMIDLNNPDKGDFVIEECTDTPIVDLSRAYDWILVSF